MVADIKDRIKLQRSIVDESFKAAHTANYHMAMEVSSGGIDIAVFDSISNKYIALEVFEFSSLFDLEAIPGLIGIIEKESKLLSSQYKAVNFVVVNNLATLVPNALYDESRKKLYLKFNAALQGDEFIYADDISSIDSKNIFALPISIKIKIESMFKNVSYHHFSSALIQEIVLQNRNNDSKKVYVNIGKNNFEIVVMDGKKLLFYNTFNYVAPEDYIYYLMFVLEQLHLNPEKAEVILLGKTDKNSEIYQLTYKYIRQVKFGNKNSSADYSYQLQEFPAHYYFSLFSSYNL